MSHADIFIYDGPKIGELQSGRKFQLPRPDEKYYLTFESHEPGTSMTDNHNGLVLLWIYGDGMNGDKPIGYFPLSAGEESLIDTRGDGGLQLTYYVNHLSPAARR